MWFHGSKVTLGQFRPRKQRYLGPLSLSIFRIANRIIRKRSNFLWYL